MAKVRYKAVIARRWAWKVDLKQLADAIESHKKALQAVKPSKWARAEKAHLRAEITAMESVYKSRKKRAGE